MGLKKDKNKIKIRIMCHNFSYLSRFRLYLNLVKILYLFFLKRKKKPFYSVFSIFEIFFKFFKIEKKIRVIRDYRIANLFLRTL